MKQLNEAVPANFRYGAEIGLLLAKQIKMALKKGVKHFEAGTCHPLLTLPRVMEAIQKDGCFLTWDASYPEGSMGLHGFGQDRFDSSAVFVMLAPEIKNQLDKKEDTEE